MKKTSIMLIAITLLLMMPLTALAEEESAATFQIDNTHVYEGMDKAYKDGYTPAVKDGIAAIVLPLVTNGEITGNVITATPGLGDASSSPFVYRNYQKTFNLNNNAVDGGALTVPSYLVRFDLELASDRINGVYPVTIEIQAQATGGSQIQQAFTTYVTIADGKDPNATEPTPKPETPTSQPKIIVSGYNINPSPAIAGEELTAVVTLQNTSKTKSVKNMTVTVSCDSPNFSLQNDSNTIYIDKLAKDITTDIELRFKTDLETPAQRYNIMLAIEYDNSDAVTLSSSGSIPVMISQPLRVEMEAPKIPEQVNAGDTMPISFQVMNMGRSKVYNVRIELSAPGLIPSGTAFIGNMEAGTASNADMDVFIGTKDMTEGYEGEDKYGFTNGKITLIYEDANGQKYTKETEFPTTINPPVISAVSAQPEEKPETASQWWISLIVGGAVVAILAIILISRVKKGKRHEDI